MLHRCNGYVWSNRTRQHINLTAVFEFAKARKQPVFTIKPADHSMDPAAVLPEWRSLVTVDSGSNGPGTGLFAYTKDMPIVINQNLYLPRSCKWKKKE